MGATTRRAVVRRTPTLKRRRRSRRARAVRANARGQRRRGGGRGRAKSTVGAQPSRSRAFVGVSHEVVELGFPALQGLVDANVLLPVEAHAIERALDELTDAVRLAGRDHVVVRLVLLEHEPHRAHVIARIPPVAPCVEVADLELMLQAEADARGGVANLARDEVQRAARRLVVVEDSGGRVQPVPEAVAPGDEVAVRLRDAVRGQRSERSLLGLWHLARLAEDLARGRLVEADRVVGAPQSLEHRRDADRSELGGEHGLPPGHGNERRSGQVVDLVRPPRRQEIDERELVQHVRLKELDRAADRLEVLERRRRRLSDRSLHLVPLGQQELGKQRAVLPGDPDDERASRSHGHMGSEPAEHLSAHATRRVPRRH